MNKSILDIANHKAVGRQNGFSCLRRETYSRVQAMVMFDRFIPVMSPDELHRFEKALGGNYSPDFSDEDFARWEAMLSERRQQLEARVDDAISKSLTPCRQRTAKQS